MPQIKRVRVANIKYDHNKKQIPDITFNLDQQNTIFLLANGGGKSLLVQLIIQTVLPNQKMGKRKIADLLESANYTGHVAVEWSLDSEAEEEHLLCTGFCFTAGQGNNSLDYYNYVIDYTTSDDFDISSLPLIKDTNLFSKREPIRFQRLKNWLHDLDRQRVEVFDTNYKYRNKLKEYKILAQEWKSIAQTNAAEGGVDDFFARSKNTTQLLNNLLIPQIREVLFSAPEQDQLFAAFDKHRNKLLRMPQIKANIKQFASITNQAEDLIDDVEQLSELQDRVEQQQCRLASLGKRFQVNQKVAEEKLQSLKQEREDLQGEIKKLSWQEKSYQVFTKKLKENEIDHKKETQEEQLKALINKQEQVEQSKRQLQALQIYNKAQKELEQLKKHEYSLEILNNKAPELREKLEVVQQSLARAWQQKEQELAAAENNKQELIAEIENKIEEITAEINTKEANKEQLISEQTTLENWLDNLNQQQKRLEKTLEVNSLSNPESVLNDKQEQLTTTERNLEQTREKIANLETKQEELSGEKLALKQQETKSEAELEKITQQLESFRTQQEQIANMLIRKGKHWSDLLAHRDQVISFVREKLTEIRKDKSNKTAETSNLEEKLALVGDKDYYIPHHMLVKVKESLEQKNIYTVLGSEWLAQQDDEKIDKESYLKQYPLLPYAILVEERQLSKIKRVLKRLELEADFPVILLIRDNLDLATDEISVHQSLMFYQPQAAELFISDESFQQFKNNLEQEIRDKKEELVDLKEQEEFYFELKTKVKSFYQQYQSEKIEKLRTTKVELQEEQRKIKKELTEVEETQSEVRKEIKQQREEINSLQHQINNLEQQVEQLIAFQEKYSLVPDKQKELQQVKQQLNGLSNQLVKMKANKEDLNAERVEEKQQLKEIYQLQEQHQQEYEKYNLEEIEAAEKVEQSYQELKNRWQELKEQLNQKQSKRAEIEELISKYRSDYRERKERINELEVSWNWLENNQRQVSKQEIKDAKQDYQNLKQQVTENKAKLQQIKDKLKEVQTEIRVRSENIREEFEREVYLDFAEHNHWQELETIKKQLANLGEQLAEIKNKIKNTAAEQQKNQEAYEDLEYQLQPELDKFLAQVEVLEAAEWTKLDLTPKQALRQELKVLDEEKTDLRKQEQLVRKNFERYINRLKNSNSPQIRQFIKNIEQIMQQGKIYNYDYVESRFLNILETFAKYKENYEREQKENEKNLQILAERSFRRAKVV
ncbi:MAG: hypothetical protein ACQERJ_00735, partial [Bacillota bacterium]